MAQFHFDPMDYAVETDLLAEPEWTSHWSQISYWEIRSGSTPFGDRYGEVSVPSNNNFISYDPAGTPGHVEVLILMRRQTGGGTGTITRATDSPRDGYIWRADSDIESRLRRYDDGLQVTLATVGKGAGGTTWVWMRQESDGSTHRVKIWDYGTTEPDWDATPTDSTYETGMVGLGPRDSSTIMQVAWFGVGTDSDAAPFPGDVVDLANAYLIFRRTPSTGEPFDPRVDTPIATVPKEQLTYDDEDLDPAEYEYQVFARKVE